MRILATIKNMSLHFGDKAVFNEAEFQISQGDRIALLGLNGQGKSTLFNVLTGEISPDNTNPKCVYDKANIDSGLSYLLVPQTLKTDIKGELGLVENYYLNFYDELRDIHLKLKDLELNGDFTNEATLEKLSNLHEKFDHLKGNDIHNKYLSFLKNLDINNLDQPIGELSGGEQRKVALSIGLSTTKHIVLWDEPTNHLDLKTIQFFEKHLKNSTSTYMLISHDRELISNCCNKVKHIQTGKVNEFTGNYYDYLEFLVEKEKARLSQLNKLENALRFETAWIRQGVKARRTRSKKRVEGYRDLKGEVSELKANKKKSIELNMQDSTRKTKNLIELTDINYSIEGKLLYESLNAKVFKGDKLAIIGNNGSGKTTLINLILENIVPNSGIVKKAQDLRVNYFSQNRKELDPNKTIWEVVGDGKDFVHFGNREQHIASYMGQFLFNTDVLKRPISTFSGGEKNRIQLALFLKNPADIWIFDEPTNDLDLESIGILEETLGELNSTAIIISHDRSFLLNVCNKALTLNGSDSKYYQVTEQALSDFLSEDQKAHTQVEAPTEKVKQKSTTKKKPTYAQKEKFKTIEADIASLELNIVCLNDKLTTASNEQDLKKLTSLNEEISVKNQELEVLFGQWQELELIFS